MTRVYTNITRFSTRALLVMSAAMAMTVEGGTARPNVVFVAIDDLRNELGCYGVSDMHTPHIDRLAENGTLFENHYVQFAVCIPSRVAMLTSLRPERTHQIYGPSVWQNTPSAMPLGKTFTAAGYATVSLGKIWHVVGGNDGDAFDVRWRPSTGGYADPENTRIARELKKFVQSSQTVKWRSGAPYSMKPPITEAGDVPDNTYWDGMVADKAVSELRRLSQDQKPFLLAVGFSKPHLPFVAPQRYWDLYNEEDMPLASNPDWPKDMPKVAFNRHINMFDYSYGSHKPFIKGKRMPDKTARHLIRAYRAATSYVDAQVGKVLAELDRLGLADNTVVVLWGDHGWHLGDNGMWSKHSNFEAATHSPLIIRAPGREHKGTRCRAMVETVDIFPTMLDLCGLPPLPVADGKSLVPLLIEPQRDWDEASFHVYNRGRQGNGLVVGHGVRTVRYRLVSWNRGWAMTGRQVGIELYDYHVDPDETQNLAENPDYTEVRERLMTLLNKHAASYANAGNGK